MINSDFRPMLLLIYSASFQTCFYQFSW